MYKILKEFTGTRDVWTFDERNQYGSPKPASLSTAVPFNYRKLGIWNLLFRTLLWGSGPTWTALICLSRIRIQIRIRNADPELKSWIRIRIKKIDRCRSTTLVPDLMKKPTAGTPQKASNNIIKAVKTCMLYHGLYSTAELVLTLYVLYPSSLEKIRLQF